MSEVLVGIIMAIIAILASAFGIQKHKTDKAVERAKVAEAEVQKAKIVNEVVQSASDIKDELASKRKEQSEAHEEVVKSIASVPDPKKKELSDEVKKLAAGQSARANARTKRMSDQNR